MMFWYLAAIAALLVVVWLAIGVRKIGAISRGSPIGTREKEALLLIDLQSVFWDHGPYSDATKQSAKEAIMREVDAAKAQGHHVVAVRQEWSIPSTKAIAWLVMKGQAIEGGAGTELAKPFAGLADQVIVKRVQDAFETGELDGLFARLGVGKLRIAGLDLNYCVLKTALAARNRGFEVVVVKKGTLSAAASERAEGLMSEYDVGLQ
jgi:nicotinamidase/pyrazinamidase